MKNKIIFLLLIITISCSIQAQEKLTYEEMFRWFPEGKYDSVAHYQLGLLHQHPYAILYKNATDKPFFAQIHPMTIPLQDQLLDDISSITILRDVRYVVYKGKQRKFLRGGIQAGFNFDDETYTANGVGIHHYVLRFDDLKPILKTLKKSGILEKTEHSFYETPVYSLTQDTRLRNSVTYFVYVTDFDELLVCEKLILLEKMVKAGNGELPNVIEKSFDPMVEEFIPLLGDFWGVQSYSHAREACIYQAEKDGIDPAIILKVRKNSGNRPAKVYRYTLNSDSITRQSGYLPTNPEDIDKIKETIDPTGKPRAKGLNGSFSYKDGISAIVMDYDQGYINRILKQRKFAKEKQEKKRQEEAK